VGKSTKLDMKIDASQKSPLVNPAFVIENWGNDPVSIELGGKTLNLNNDYFVGYDSRLEGTDLVIWLKIESHKPIRLSMK